LIKFADVRIETDRLVLRPLVPSDAPAIFAMRSDADLLKYWDAPPYTDPRQAEEMVAKSQAAIADNAMLELGIELREVQGVVGTVCLHTIHWASERGEIGYTLAREQHGKGLMTEALTALINFVFGEMGFRRLEADIHPDNGASRTVLERLGFQREGYMLERWNVAGDISDTEFFGLLARNWNRGAGT